MKNKNFDFRQRLLSILTAGMILVTPTIGKADSNTENDNEQEFALVMQEKDFTPMTIEEYRLGIKEAYNYLKMFIDYDYLQQDLQCLYYLVNRDYLTGATEEDLINNGIVFETSINEQKFENFMHAYNLLNVIADYNQSMIRDTNNICEMIDVSMLCYGSYDRKLTHNMHENYFQAYKNGRFNNEYYEMVFKQLTTLNAYEKAGNASELSVGARWLAQNSIGGGVMQLLRDDMQEDFPRSELDKYFDKAELNHGQWILKDDISLDLNCLKNELEEEVFNFGELWHFVYTTVNNDIMKSFEVDCTKSK